jgi:NADH-quinone oxidoreductase subunit L
MRLPLVVLAAGAALAGLLGTPLDNFLAPVFSSSTTVPLSSSVSDALGAVDAVVAILGIGIAWALWRGRVERPELTPRFLLRVWYWDDLYDAVLGRPGTALARTSAQLIDPVVIDGAVVGTAVAVRRTARQVRQLQNGYVRSYALTIAVGLALLISYLLARTF